MLRDGTPMKLLINTPLKESKEIALLPERPVKVV
jgi:hypothetical protein